MSTPSKMSSTVRTVAVCFHMHPAAFIGRLRTIASSCGVHLKGVVVSNNQAHSLRSPTEDFKVIRGSNAHLDFSGYFEGLAWWGETASADAASSVLFVNDSLIIKHAAASILQRVLCLNALLSQMSVPAIGGKMDTYRSICLRNPWSGQDGYISSYCFLLNSLGLPAISRLLADAAGDGVLSTSHLADPAWGAGLAPALRESIRAHLIYEGSPYRWRSVGDRNGLILQKARCVYFESRLSGAIGLDGALVPINSGPRSDLQILLREAMARILRRLRGARS